MQYNLADLFESVADAVPERIALVCGSRRMPYAELDARASRLGHALAARGIGPGDHVGLQMKNGAEYVESMLACFKVRAVPINVNFRYVEDELRHLYRDADLRALIFHREFAPRVASARAAATTLERFLVVEDGARETTDAEPYEDALAGAPAGRGFAPRSPDDLYVIYTGGTTGMPKGVMWRHEDAFYACMMGANPMGPPPERPEQVAERAVAKTPFGMMTAAPLIHGAAQLGTMIAMLQGAKAVIAPRFDPAEIWEVIERERVMTLSLVGDAMARPLAEALHANDGRWDVSSLLVLSSAGALLSPAVKDQLRSRLPKLGILDNFGSSESGSQGMDAGVSSPEGGMRFRMNEKTAVLGDDLRPIEPGSGRIGRIALRGHIPLGYYKDAEKTAKTFVVDPDGVRWVMPGDLARPEADGSITVLGRGSTCINTGGEKVYPEEVEGALKAHPGVFDAIVVGVPDARFGQRVAAVVQTRPGAAPSEAELVAHCRAHVAGYKTPREVHFVDAMVRSPSGKPDYPWARELARARSEAGGDAR